MKSEEKTRQTSRRGRLCPCAASNYSNPCSPTTAASISLTSATLCQWRPLHCCCPSNTSVMSRTNVHTGHSWNIHSEQDIFTSACHSLHPALVTDSDTDNEDPADKETELTFFNDDGSCKTVIVESNLCAGDLCQLLALKNHASKDGNWSIIEYWPEYGIERTLEDHEKVFSVYQDMIKFDRLADKKFIFRKDFRKYEVFYNPQQFFPLEMIDFGVGDGVLAESPSLAKVIAIQEMVNAVEGCPQVFGHLWVREANKQVWRKAFFLLKNSQLLFSYKIQSINKLQRSKREKDLPIKPEDDLQCYADLKQYTIYSTFNAKNHFKAPTEFGLCLRPIGGSTSANPSQELMCIACDTERARLCWLTAIRLAKDGRKLREMFRQSRAKMVDNRSQSPKEYSSQQVSMESIRSRVAMDFTGPYGRIVEDPQEAKAIAVAEGYFWKRRRKPSGRQTPCANQGPTAMLGSGTQIPLGSSVPASMSGFSYIGTGLNSGIHITQPWFHSGLSREEAAQLLTKHGTVDGVFVVRESRSKAGIFVLSYVYRNKIFHAQITTVIDQGLGNVCFTLDGGKTRFYDLLQLVEFYQLNSGSLPSRLTYYVMQTHNGAPIASSF